MAPEQGASVVLCAVLIIDKARLGPRSARIDPVLLATDHKYCDSTFAGPAGGGFARPARTGLFDCGWL
jgi:hypothetical protein